MVVKPLNTACWYAYGLKTSGLDVPCTITAGFTVLPFFQTLPYLSEGEVEDVRHGVVGSHIGTPLVVHLAHHVTPH